MKKVLAALAVASVLVTAGPAFAQPWGRPGPGFPGKDGGPGPGPQPMPARQWSEGRGGPPHRGGERLSPEERRELRRDIEQHGREIYPDPRRPPPRP